MNIKWIGSPFFLKGRTQKISKIVIHWMNGTLASTDQTFQTKGVSAHYGIENTKIHQYVREVDTAFHAISANPFSIGLEHSAAPGRPPTEATYKTSAQLIASLCEKYKFDPRKVLEPHCKYVATRCCGTDTKGKVIEKGGVDINKLKTMAYNLMQENDMYKGKTAKQWHDEAVRRTKQAQTYQKQRNAFKKKWEACKSGSDSVFRSFAEKVKALNPLNK